MLARLDVSIQSIAGGQRLPRYRIGDFALFLLWAMFAVGAGAVALREARDHDELAAVYRAMMAVGCLINSILFLLRGPASSRSPALIPKLIALIGTWSVVPLSALPMTWRPDWLLALTTVGLICAYAFVIWALLTLRRNFSVFPEARNLVRHGPYSLVRHPLYAAYILTYLLVAVPRLSLAALILAALGIAGEAWRARNEERVLVAAFSDYGDYAAKTPRFIPQVSFWPVWGESPNASSGKRS
jgi:protein-S-isoprenylcysteine O-methyltransferase Ste14